MNIFRLTIIPGTEKVVEKELLSKFPKVEIVTRTKEKIDFQTEDLVLENFRYLLSPIRIQDTNHKDIDLFKREWRKGFVPAGITPPLAYVLCDLADLKKEDIVLDPFCGGSTIPITAAMYFGIKKALASDISGKAIDISQKNWEASKVRKDRFVLFKSDVAKLKLTVKSVSKVITNMPFGIRVGSHDQNEKIYQDFAIVLDKILTDEGLAIVLTQEKELIERVMKKYFDIQEVMTPEVGGLRPSVYKITKKGGK
jgi:23S rRNA G2445 N2-methylase RlmL